MRSVLAFASLAGSLALLVGVLVCPSAGHAIGEPSAVDLRIVDYSGGRSNPRPSAARRLAWEIRQRTSVETRLEPSRARLDSQAIFESPVLYWSGNQPFPALSEGEVTGLRRFVEFGGTVLIDDASPDLPGFDESVRRELQRAFGEGSLVRVPQTHTVYRSFYLLSRPVGRVEGPAYLEAIERGGRLGVIYSRHDLGGAWARDNLGNWRYPIESGRRDQREQAFRLGVNLVLYTLCQDYKDDQVHSPFIMRRTSPP